MFAERAAPPRGAQLLLDLSVLVHADDKSGVQRVVRNVLRALLQEPPAGFTVEPVYDAGGYYAYAHRFMRAAGLAPQARPGADGDDAGAGADSEADGDADADGPQRPGDDPADPPLRVRAGDIFLGLDLAPNHVPNNRALLASLRAHGVRLYFVVYDLLPVKQPAMFIAGAKPWFETWIGSVAALGDGLLCISRAVADEVTDWLDEHPAPNMGALRVGYFHLGADLDATPSRTALTAPEAGVLAQVAQRPTLLMVGTLEPRKMHAQALAAFDRLWQDGVEVNLVIVGKQGWLVEALVERLRAHPQRGRRLFWLETSGDGALLQLYAQCSALLAASCGEGFGLPLIEAAQHGLPVIARDIAVFREVAGAHAFYFKADNGAELAEALQAWLALRERGQAPASNGMPWMTWAQSARQLVERIERGQWLRQAASRLI
jgi:glycosyltransferase involved in cell wall biosynthesis